MESQSSTTSTPPTSTSSSPDNLDDIFSDDPLPSAQPLSDLPALRRQHVTAGYREGLSLAKAKTIQSGFDSGYPSGVELGMRVGRVLGVLEGVISAVGKDGGDMEGRLKAVLKRVKTELGVERFLEGVSDEDMGREGAIEWKEEVLRKLGVWEEVVERVAGRGVS